MVVLLLMVPAPAGLLLVCACLGTQHMAHLRAAAAVAAMRMIAAGRRLRRLCCLPQPLAVALHAAICSVW
jgi:hypothetical protein